MQQSSHGFTSSGIDEKSTSGQWSDLAEHQLSIQGDPESTPGSISSRGGPEPWIVITRHAQPGGPRV